MARESRSNLKKRAAIILAALKRAYPDAKCSLNYRTPLQLLVATILSAQCTDVRVNIVTKDLFRKYRTAKALAAVSQEVLQEEIRSTGFYRNKAQSVRGSAARIIEKFGGKVPDRMEDLLALPGVARKTANVVLGNAYGKNEGIVVDTHVQRIAQRLRLTPRKNNQGDKMEKDLIELVPREDWTHFGHLLIFHGRAICTARTPHCAECPINDPCPSAFKV